MNNEPQSPLEVIFLLCYYNINHINKFFVYTVSKGLINVLNKQQLISEFIEWSTENIGEKTGGWYSPYLESMGYYLKLFEFEDVHDLEDDFFEYNTYDSFYQIYQQLFKESEETIAEVIKGKNKRYPKETVLKISRFTENYAQYTYENGERSKPDNTGGIPSIGAVCRAYLRFLYYREHSHLTYPKKNEKIKTQEGTVDDSINYWLYAAGEHSVMWKEFYDSGVMGLGWDYLGDLSHYDTREDIEAAMMKNREDEVVPRNDSLAVWDFFHDMDIGDVIFVKQGIRELIGKGVVTGEYFFDSKASTFKHRRKVDWVTKGEWSLDESVAQKTLTKINNKTDLIDYANRLINEEELPDEKTKTESQFELWLADQKLPSGEYMNDKTVKNKVNALKHAEKRMGVDIFEERDPVVLEDISEEFLKTGKDIQYKGVFRSALDYYLKFIESRPIIREEAEKYTKADFLEEVYIDESAYNNLTSILQNKMNIILKGAPGVGKTFMADRLAYSLMGEKDESRLQFIQFHQSYSYEDFIEGFRPKEDGEGFEKKTGPFVKFARKASEDPERDYFFIIDEINRGNMSKIFGELMMLIEKDKRGKSVNLLYSNEPFSVPDNLFIIGMMNTADRSLALLDYALRRRFAFIDVKPAFDSAGFRQYIDTLEYKNQFTAVIDTIKSLNAEIREDLGAGFEIGHSYFLGGNYRTNTVNRLRETVNYEIGPQLREYWFDDLTKADQWIERLMVNLNDNK